MDDTRFWHPFADMGAVRGNELVIERGEDVWVWDTEGRRYLDATASLWYANVGHGRTEIHDAIAAQLAKIEAYSMFGDLASAPTLELAERLAEHAPMPSRIFMTSGGGDSIDVAAKLARRYWFELGEPDRVVLVSRTQGYHGTHGYGTAIGGIARQPRRLRPAGRVRAGPPRLGRGARGGDRARRREPHRGVLRRAGDRRRRRPPARPALHRGRRGAVRAQRASCSSSTR